MDDESNSSDVIVIGGVACGPKTAATLARRKPDYKIILFQKEKDLSYGTCGLPYFASGDIANFEQLTKTSYGIIRSPEFFENSKGFEVRTGAEVIAIDRERKTVRVKMTATGETFDHHYGKLVLATGSVPIEPPLPVPQSPYISHFTRPADAIGFRELAERGQIGKVAIIGAGFIGCEVAEAAAGLWGIETVLIEKQKHILPTILDPEMAAIAERELMRQNVELITEAEVKKIETDAEGKPLVFVCGRDPIRVDHVFLCLGVRPNISLAKSAGIAVNERNGIKVDATLQTSDPDIFAGGDCIESHHRITGEVFYMPMGSLANRHGRVIAENVSGNRVEFAGVVGAFLIKIFDLNVGAVGLSERSACEAGFEAKSVWGAFGDKPDYYPESNVLTLKMIYDSKSRRLLGLQAAGQGDICRRIDTASAMLRTETTIDEMLDFEHGYAPPYAEALDPLHHMAALGQAQERGIRFSNPGSDGTGIDEDIVLLDVRENEEIEAEPWPETGQKKFEIPLNELRKRLDELPKNGSIRVICKRGPRSYQSAHILRKAGYNDVEIIGGGYQASQR